MNSTPDNNSFQLDNRRPLELQNFVLQFAAKMKIEKSEAVENWQKYLLKDLSFRLAYLLSIDYNSKIDVDEQLSFIEETKEYLSEQADQHNEDTLLKKVQKDFEDLIHKFLPEGEDANGLKDFYKHLRANFFETYKESLNVKSDHAPDIGLIFTFIQLFHEHLLPDINKLPPRLTQFYYESIINKKRLPALPDIAHVYFEPAKFVKQSVIDKRASLYAGKGIDKNNIIFETHDAVHISQAVLQNIYTLYFAASDESGTRGIFKRNCFSGEAYKAYETFGKNIALYKEPEIEEIAEFGFAIASKLLYLKEGERYITVRFPIPEDTGDDWQKVFEEKCYFEITTEKGWVAAKNADITSNANSIEIKLIFSKEDNPIDAFAEFSELPALRCMLNRIDILNRVQYYNQLKNFEISPKSVDIEVEVNGIQGLTCYNDLGVLNISQPFQPFGATPSKYSKFIIGNAEAFQKPLDKVTLQLDWNISDWNFENYFRAYNRNDITKLEEYQVKFSTSRGYNTNGLFENLNDEMRSSSITSFVEVQQFEHGDWSSELPAYSKDVKWGYLEMQLISPSNPFGTGLYQQVIANQIGKDVSEDTYLINPPMIPELRGVELSYKSRFIEEENDREHQFYHIHPFGKELVKDKKSTLLSRKYEQKNTTINYHGMLFLGIKDLVPGLLSIYFELAGSSLIQSNSETKVTPPAFFMVSDNELFPITKVSDSTEGFEQSGIIQLNIESNLLLAAPSTILPSSLNWIAVVVEENAESFGFTKRINLHGTTAVRVNGIVLHEQNEEVSIESGSIVRTHGDNPVIKSVIQPSSTFNGRTREEVFSFSNRVSTEIRHRYRPSTGKDIEAIIYNEFPQVHQCRVFSDKNQLRVVLVPHKHLNTLRPAFPISFLMKVRAFLEKLVSPFFNLLIENPHYAVLQTHLLLTSKVNLLNVGQLEYNVKQSLIRNYLNPWISKNIPIGEVPNFQLLASSIEEDYKGLMIQDFVFYYYYFKGRKRHFHYFKHNSINEIKSKNVIFVSDLSEENHNIFFDNQKWTTYLYDIEDMESDGTVIKGFQIPFDEISL